MHFQRQTGEELTLQLMFYLVRPIKILTVWCVVCDALICQVRFLSNYSMETNYFKVKSYKLASLENHKPDNIVLNSPISSGLFSKSRSKFEAFASAKKANNTSTLPLGANLLYRV